MATNLIRQQNIRYNNDIADDDNDNDNTRSHSNDMELRQNYIQGRWQILVNFRRLNHFNGKINCNAVNFQKDAIPISSGSVTAGTNDFTCGTFHICENTVLANVVVAPSSTQLLPWHREGHGAFFESFTPDSHRR